MTMFSSLHDDFMDAPLPAVAQGETKCWRWCGLKFCRCYPPPRPQDAPRARDVGASNASGRESPSLRGEYCVRRITPLEAERLQGFPDGFTNIPWRGRNDAPDTRRYKALGNSMAVPVMRWILDRLRVVDATWEWPR